MRILGGAIRYFLNINTIWGLMILTAFVLCVWQHYLPTLTTIPADRLRDGANTVTVKIKGAGEKIATFEWSLLRQGDSIVLTPDQQASSKDRPWLITAAWQQGACLLTWDYAGYGKYEMAVNGTAVARGSLVTLQGLTNTALDKASAAFTLALGWVATMVLFLGLMKVGEDAGIVQLVARVFHPLLRLIFPGVPKEHPASGALLMNMTTSVLGLGNAATPFGLKAMKELQTLNKHSEVATDPQVTLLAWNTGGLALLPTTLIAARKAAGCTNPLEIVGTCLLGGLFATTVAVITARLLSKLPVFSVAAALREEAVPEPQLAAVGAGSGDEEDRA